MLGIRIEDKKNSLRGACPLIFDVRDILVVIEDLATTSQWSCTGLWYTTVQEGQFVNPIVLDLERRLTNEEFSQFVSSIHQTIDGRFEAYEEGAKQPWLRILAVDSTYFEVWSANNEALLRLKEHFQAVTSLPSRISSYQE